MIDQSPIVNWNRLYPGVPEWRGVSVGKNADRAGVGREARSESE